MIKVGLIGIGSMGFVHYEEYKKIEDAAIVAVADVRVDMAKEKIGNDDVRVYKSIDELLANEDVDMVDICTPSFLHPEQSIKALEAGKHVLCEKPMCVTSEETKHVIEVAEKSGKFFMTAHVVRFMTAYKYLKSVVDSQELGKPLHIEMKRLSSIPRWSWENWMRDVKKSGGSPIDLSIHDIDFIQDVFGQPEKITGTYRKIKDDSNYLVSNLVYDGFDVLISGGWFKCDIPFTAEYFAIFEKGIVESTGGVVRKNGEEINISKADFNEIKGMNLSVADGYGDEILYFIECIKNGTKPMKITPQSSADSVELVERIIKNSVNVF